MSAILKTALAFALVVTGNSAIAADKPRLLTREEGATLADFAARHHPTRRRPDCSHLVHEMLTDAGLPYPYAPSSSIFVGLPQFRLVARPQPGDLIVWPGHVGLIVDPHQHTFLSSTRTGIRTKDYTTAYWRSRGHPRIYRYVVTDDGERTRLAQLAHSTR